MKLHVIAFAALTLPVFTGASQSQTLTADSCQPLTDQNRAACCSAPNWRDIILPESHATCEESGQNLQQPADGAVGSTTPSADDTVGSTTPPAGSTEGPDTGDSTTAEGNPGNTAPTGQAGEKDMNNESPSTGTKGTSND